MGDGRESVNDVVEVADGVEIHFAVFTALFAGCSGDVDTVVGWEGDRERLADEGGEGGVGEGGARQKDSGISVRDVS